MSIDRKIAFVAMTAAVLALLIVPVSAVDSTTTVNIYDSDYCTVGVEQITSASQLPSSLRPYYTEGQSVALAYSLPSENPYGQNSRLVCDFKANYSADKSTTISVHAAAVDSSGRTAMTIDNGSYAVSSGDGTLYLFSDYLSDERYSAYDIFQHTGGKAYAVANVGDEGDFSCVLTLVVIDPATGTESRVSDYSSVSMSPAKQPSVIVIDNDDNGMSSTDKALAAVAIVAAAVTIIVVAAAILHHARRS